MAKKTSLTKDEWAALKKQAREHNKQRLAKLHADNLKRYGTEVVKPLKIIRTLADAVSYRERHAAGKPPRISEVNVGLLAKSWDPKRPADRLEKLVLGTVIAQTGALRAVFANDIWDLWEAIEPLPAKSAAKQTALLAHAGYRSLAAAKRDAKKRRNSGK